MLKNGKVLGELYAKIESTFVPKMMTSREGNLISTKDMEGKKLMKVMSCTAIKEYNPDLFEQIDKDTAWRSDMKIKHLAKKYDYWLAVDKRTREKTRTDSEIYQETKKVGSSRNLRNQIKLLK